MLAAPGWMSRCVSSSPARGRLLGAMGSMGAYLRDRGIRWGQWAWLLACRVGWVASVFATGGEGVGDWRSGCVSDRRVNTGAGARFLSISGVAPSSLVLGRREL